MAVLAVAAMSDTQQDSKILHPFFVKRSKSKEDLNKTSNDSISAATTSDTGDFLPLTGTVPQSTGSNKAGGGRPKERLEREEGAELLEVDPNLERRKRRKSTSVEHYPQSSEFEVSCQAKHAVGNDNTVRRERLDNDVPDSFFRPSIADNSTELPLEPASKVGTAQSFIGTNLDSFPSIPVSRPIRPPSATNAQVIEVSIPQTPLLEVNTPDPGSAPTRKLLQLNPKTGTIGSPPKSKSRPAEIPKDKIRKPRNKKGTKSMIVAIKYGHDSESRMRIGRRIDQIIGDPPTILIAAFPVVEFVPKAPQASRTVSLPGPPKITHPFFLGKATPKPEITPAAASMEVGVAVAPSKASPSKARMMFTTPRPKSPVKQTRANASGFGHAFGNSSKIMKFPGAVEPCWPPRQMMHVRDCEMESHDSLTSPIFSDTFKAGRKSKHAVVQIPASEEIIRKMTPGLHIAKVAEELSHTRSDEFAQPNKLLRVPAKHFQSGSQLQKKVKAQLISSLSLPVDLSSSEDEIGTGFRSDAKAHPALERVYQALPTSLTAFDRSTYETQSWTIKYAPRNAAEVLQSGKEAFILKDWLLALTVVAVDTGANDSRSRAGSVASRRSAGKRKRKSNKLDGFLVSSGEEDNDMDEISEAEDDVSPRGSQGLLKRTVIRAGDAVKRESGKLANAVVISGPSGCGKTAAVYAVAKELGFEVFEINSASRRSGKDVLEKVGDMTRNHQVQRAKQGSSDLADDDITHVTEALAEDLRSGRQGTMNSFFKPQDTKPMAAKGEISRVEPTKDQKSLKAPPKPQKQSLILLEEVDILFEEDKQFWATIMTLIAQSKRPIIMTCNDESLVPLQSLILHAIIRLAPPPLDIAVDYMLLVAAAEGHIIQRQAAKSLFEARGLDLRASLTDLDYWCQLGVGDCKGGLDWFYPRWPPGSDVDDQGNTIRVVSEGTYEVGMGWLGRDSLCGLADETDVQQEVFQELWDGWQIEPPFGSPRHESLTLDSYVDWIESMSAADMSACGRLAKGNQTLLDTTLPLLPVKTRDDFILGRELLEAELLHNFDSTSNSIAFYIQNLADTEVHSGITVVEPYGVQTTASRAIDVIAKNGLSYSDSISRSDFSIAFDPIAEPERKTWSSNSLELSVFDRTTSMIAMDVAPYVRSIVAYDARLQQDRAHLSNLLSEGGRKGKRMRTTRAALSALEGGARNTTRPERYFGPALNYVLVLKTGHQSWQAAAGELADVARMQEGKRDQTRDESSSPGE